MGRGGIWLAALAALLTAPAALAAPPAGLCQAPGDLLRPAAALRGAAAALRDGNLRIAAFGSSSTWGQGASSPDLAYPARLQALLRAARPGARIVVVNFGAGGTDAEHAVERMRHELPSLRPHLILWQVGANDAMRGLPLDGLAAALDDGIALARRAGADVLLVPPQSAPRLLDVPNLADYLAAVDKAGLRHDVTVFPRFALMRAAPDPAAFIDPDGLHLNDLGYRCWAEQIAFTILGE